MSLFQVLKMTEFLAVPLAVLHTSACISAKRICPLRISARGDTQLIVHFLKREREPKFTKYPLAEMHIFVAFPQGGIVGAG